jgi:hypothetical protein
VQQGNVVDNMAIETVDMLSAASSTTASRNNAGRKRKMSDDSNGDGDNTNYKPSKKRGRKAIHSD